MPSYLLITNWLTQRILSFITGDGGLQTWQNNLPHVEMPVKAQRIDVPLLLIYKLVYIDKEESCSVFSHRYTNTFFTHLFRSCIPQRTGQSGSQDVLTTASCCLYYVASNLTTPVALSSLPVSRWGLQTPAENCVNVCMFVPVCAHQGACCANIFAATISDKSNESPESHCLQSLVFGLVYIIPCFLLLGFFPPVLLLCCLLIPVSLNMVGFCLHQQISFLHVFWVHMLHTKETNSPIETFLFIMYIRWTFQRTMMIDEWFLRFLQYGEETPFQGRAFNYSQFTSAVLVMLQLSLFYPKSTTHAWGGLVSRQLRANYTLWYIGLILLQSQ